MGQTQGQGLGQGHGLGQGQSRAFAPPSVADLEDLLDADNDNAHDNDDYNDDNNGRGGSNVRHAYVDDGGDGEDDGYGRNSHNDRRGSHRQPQQQQQQQQQHHKQNPQQQQQQQQQQQHESYQQQHDNQGKKQRKGPAPAQGLDVVSGARGMDESVPYESRRPDQDDRNHRGKGTDKGHTESSLRVGDSGPGTRARSQSRERPPDARARDQGPPMLPLPRKDKDKDKNVSNDHTDSQSSSNVHHHDNTNSSPTRRQKGDKGKGKGKTAAIVAAAAAGGRGIVERVDEEAQLLAELYALEQRQQQKLADLSVYAVGTTVTTGPSASAVNLNSVAFVNAGVGVGVGGSVDDNHPSNSASHGKPRKADPLKDREKLAFKPGAKDHRCVSLLASCLATHPLHTINHHLTFIKPPRPNQSQIILIESNPFSSLTYLIFSFQLHPSLFRRHGTFGVPAALPKVKKAKKPLALVPDAWGENDPLGPSPDPGAAARGGVITGSIISKTGSEGASGGPPPLAHGALGIADLPPPVTNQKAAAIAATLSPSGGCVHWHTPSLTHTLIHLHTHTLSLTRLPTLPLTHPVTHGPLNTLYYPALNLPSHPVPALAIHLCSYLLEYHKKHHRSGSAERPPHHRHQHSGIKNPFNIPHQHTLSTHPIVTSYQRALSTYHIHITYKHSISIHCINNPIDTPYQPKCQDSGTISVRGVAPCLH